MMADIIDLNPLENATRRLTEGFARYRLDTSDDQLRDGLIQRFEYTYDLSHRTLKRHLESVSATPGQVDAMAFADMIRTANEQGLLRSDWQVWKRYRELRSKTSHTYNENAALEVVAGVPEFLEEAEFLLTQLKKRITP